MLRMTLCTATLSTAVLAIAVATADANVTLRANSQWTETHTGSQVDKWWAEEIARRTNGEVDIKLFFGEALGTASENLALLQQGAIDIAMMSPGYFPAQLPFHAAPNSIPMAMSEVEQATELMQRLMAEMDALDEEARDNGVKTLFFHHLNPYHLVCREPITSVAELRGKKIRTWGNDLPQAMEAIGATPVTLFLPEFYEGISRGTVDCLPLSVDLMLDLKIHEVAKHVSDITIWLGPTNATWISLEAWDRLTPAQQEIVLDVSQEAMLRDRDATIEAGRNAIQELKGAGVEFHKFPVEEADQWRQTNPDFFAQFIEEMDAKGKGEDAREMIDIWKSVIGQES